jgi:hypothetical protein
VCGQPAAIGDVLTIYAAGLGLATPNGSPCQPGRFLSGLSPGSAGEYQVIVKIPAGVTNGDQIPVSLSILGGIDGSTTISVQPALPVTAP